MGNNEPTTQYFAEKEEKAVLDYIRSNSLEEKNKIYNEILIEPFRKMIESILRRYPIHIGNYEMKEVESNALTHLIEHMIKYRPFIIERNVIDSEKWVKLNNDYRFFHATEANEKLRSLIERDCEHSYRLFNSKAFSYCQTIIRNYYKDHSKKSSIEMKTNLSFDDYVDEFAENNEYSYEIENDAQIHLDKLINAIVDKIELKINTDPAMKKLEIIVGDAIINILKNWNVLFMEETPCGKYNKKVTNKFAKNKILLFLKEQTELTTKEIRVGIKPFKELYFLEKFNSIEL
jgi:hypothetical protein